MVNGFSELAEANLRTLRNDRNILHPQRCAILGQDHRAFDVLGSIDQSDGTHVDLLQTRLYEAPSCVDVIIRKLLLDLGQTQPVSDQLVWVDANLVFACGAAKAGNVDDVGHSFEVLFDDPVFNRLQFHRVVGRIGTVQCEEVDLADWAPVRAHLWYYAWRQSDLAQTFQNPLPVPVVIRLVVENQLQVGESEERERTQMHHVRDAIHDDFERNRDLLLDLLRGNSRPLRNDFNVVICYVGIGLNGKVMESDDARCEKQQRKTQH